MKAFISQTELASINTIAVAASKEKDVAPVLTTIALTNENGIFRAFATDRYMIVSGRYDGVRTEGWEDGAIVKVSPAAIKSALDVLKARPKWDTAPAILEVENGVASIVIDGTSIIADPPYVTGEFPPVLKLFPDLETATGVATIGLKPDFVARLSKVLPPEARPQKERVWRFTFFGSETKKPMPIHAEYRGSGYLMEALIQPAIIK